MPRPKREFWFPHAQIARLRCGGELAICLPNPALVHWGIDGWRSSKDVMTTDTGLDIHMATIEIPDGARQIDFTFRWEDTQQWAGRDFHVATRSATCE